jgi:hypothetical protein
MDPGHILGRNLEHKNITEVHIMESVVSCFKNRSNWEGHDWPVELGSIWGKLVWKLRELKKS